MRPKDPGQQPGPLMDADGPLMKQPSSRLEPQRHRDTETTEEARSW